MGFFQRLKQGLTKTRGGLTNKVKTEKYELNSLA